jgi:Methyltransferase domain
VSKTIVPAVLLALEDFGAYVGDRYWETDYYPKLLEITERFQPKSILEIGIRYGYSLGVMMQCKSVSHICGVDCEEIAAYGGTQGAYRLLRRIMPPLIRSGAFWPNVSSCYFANVNTQVVADLTPFVMVAESWKPKKFEMISIDGDHSIPGLRHDLCHAGGLLAPGGVILVDDADHPAHPLRVPTEVWAKETGYKSEYIPDESRGRVILYK